MEFEEKKTYQKAGEKAGFIFGYLLFTLILYLILLLSKKIPVSWSYVHIMGITVLVVVLGAIITRLLK